ncbi:glycosyltransferase [Klebsiella pneumoniae]|uniref:glycosyltransferase n=1 Tax=Klebsiella pneumoniae TaxID=573 RepID=UPI0040365712
MNNSVSIVLAAFNGEKFIREQLESIVDSEGFSSCVKEIIITDDGSSDKTIAIVEQIKRSRSLDCIKIVYNDQHGIINNFCNGLSYCSGEYIVLSDQDDIWEPKKITILKNALDKCTGNNITVPALVFSDSIMVNECNEIISESFFNYNKINVRDDIKIQSLLTKNIAQGCVMMFNKALMKKIDFSTKKHWVMHDWYLLLLASYLGRVCSVDNKLIRYRIHGNNALGFQKQTVFSKIASFKKIFQKYRIYIDKVINQACFFETEMNVKKNEILTASLFLKNETTFMRKIMSLYNFNYIKKRINYYRCLHHGVFEQGNHHE